MLFQILAGFRIATLQNPTFRNPQKKKTFQDSVLTVHVIKDMISNLAPSGDKTTMNCHQLAAYARKKKSKDKGTQQGNRMMDHVLYILFHPFIAIRLN